MITLCYLGEAITLDLQAETNLLIVRKPPAKIPNGFIHIPQLSPSASLFSQTQVWKEEMDKDQWWPLYVDRFEREMKERDDLVRALHKLERRVSEGQRIRLFCYCKDVDCCHRGLLGKEMERRGVPVHFRRIAPIQKIELEAEQLSWF